MNRITKYSALVIMILMFTPSQSDACTPRLRTPQARTRAMQLSQAITARVHMPIYRAVKFTKRCKSGICNRR